MRAKQHWSSCCDGHISNKELHGMGENSTAADWCLELMVQVVNVLVRLQK
jgi:hypothetical protein